MFDINRTDPTWLQAALTQARLALPISSPNPPVGCVIVRDDRLIGQGHTQQAGGPHAEVMAMRDAQARGESLQGATAYVTLEPCSHHGRTPPCADALIREGLARVVVALHDPNPLVAGQGVARLRAAGIAVDELPPDHPAAIEAREIKIGFLSRMVRQRPWVRLKVAASLDGRTALDNGVSKWITSSGAREDGQHWRARASAVLTGIGTVLDDNPRLDVRAFEVPRQPLRVVLDSRWRMPPDSAMLGTQGGLLVVGLAPIDEDAKNRQSALLAAGAEVLEAPPSVVGRPSEAGDSLGALVLPGVSVQAKAQANGGQASATAVSAQATQRTPQVDLAWLLSELARRGVNELHVEAGARLNGHLIEQGWVDEILVYLAPKLLGPGRALAALSPLTGLDGCWQGEVRDLCLVGPDARLIVRPPGRERF
ncbi:MAG: bifunctional diaminohydroxyphosphoribosylaminopyrimidine deaminase/5-amino-6-(5-phosphoribosylamino)uracil reductase RibD [Gammaproteobacteria bacterium]|nr:bifunctional diaminohydroxyphosphoribosylaminopyrimidine deaminase/5-amino-6-(5-phosphoribosylamino)uracil reductase RibD [Gammaproteobacteria bacterium]